MTAGCTGSSSGRADLGALALRLRSRFAPRRLWASERLRRALLGPTAGGAPLHYIVSIADASWRPYVAPRVRRCRTVSPARIMEYAFPEHFPRWFPRVKAFDARNVYTLSDVCVSPRTGLAWIPGGPMLQESFGGLVRSFGWGNDTLIEPLLPPTRLPQPIVVLSCEGYFHWLIESLPSFLTSWEECRRQHLVLVSRDAPSYALQALQMLGIPATPCDGPVRAAEAVVTAVEPASGYAHPDDVALLRRTFLQGEPQPDTGRQRIYVSRRLDSKRPLRNESEVESALAARGWRILYAQRLTFAEQVRAFRGASSVVGPHGAGLANIVWSDPGTKIIEIFPANDFNACYATLALATGHHYDYTVASPDAGTAGRVDVQALLAMLEAP